MIKKFSFGKVDGYGNGRKSCEVEVEFGFREFAGQEPYFSVCAGLWNNRHTDYITCGQCLDDLFNEYKSLRHNRLYNEIYSLWTQYHLKNKKDIPAEIIAEIENILLKGDQDNVYVAEYEGLNNAK